MALAGSPEHILYPKRITEMKLYYDIYMCVYMCVYLSGQSWGFPDVFSAAAPAPAAAVFAFVFVFVFLF